MTDAAGVGAREPGDLRSSAADARRGIDWRAIERDYRSGVLSLRALARLHGCAHSTIANFAGRHGWTRRPSGGDSGAQRLQEAGSGAGDGPA